MRIEAKPKGFALQANKRSPCRRRETAGFSSSKARGFGFESRPVHYESLNPKKRHYSYMASSEISAREKKIQCIEDIKRNMEKVGAQYPSLRDKPHLQFLYVYMWFNFNWQNAERPPEAILQFLCDNRNDQSIDAFYFDDELKVVYLVQSKYTHDWLNPGRINYNDLKRTADVAKYFESQDLSSVIYTYANEKCKRLLAKAIQRKSEGYDIRIILVSNKLEPNQQSLDKLGENVDLQEWKFNIDDQERIMRIYLNFLEGHTPPLPPYKITTIDEKHVYVSEPEYGIEAYAAAVEADELIELYNR
ncbi:MAG: hypothetical protein QXH91_05755, partial [Candidatus Bathyarchaeia archaeon]